MVDEKSSVLEETGRSVGSTLGPSDGPLVSLTELLVIPSNENKVVVIPSNPLKGPVAILT